MDIADLQKELDAVQVRKKAAQLAVSREAKAEQHLLWLIEYKRSLLPLTSGDGIGSEHQAQTDAFPLMALEGAFNEEEISGAVEEYEGKPRRKRLPKGFIRKAVFDALKEVGRFLFATEFEEVLSRKIEEAYPNEPGLSANRKSISRMLLKLYEEGELVRIIYDDLHQFHGLPQFAYRGPSGEAIFNDPTVVPDLSLVGGVENDVPQFAELESEADAKREAMMT